MLDLRVLDEVGRIGRCVAVCCCVAEMKVGCAAKKISSTILIFIELEVVFDETTYKNAQLKYL